MTLTTVEGPFLGLAEIKRKKREAQRQLELLTCRINHIENKEKEHSSRSNAHHVVLEQRFRTRLTALELKRMLKERRLQDKAEHYTRTLEVRRRRQQLKEGCEMAVAAQQDHRRRVSVLMRTTSKTNRSFHSTQLQQQTLTKREQWQAMRHTSGMALFRRKMRENHKKLRLDQQRRQEALRIEREAQKLESGLEQLYDNIELERQRTGYCKKINDRLAGELFDDIESSRQTSPHEF